MKTLQGIVARYIVLGIRSVLYLLHSLEELEYLSFLVQANLKTVFSRKLQNTV